MASLLEYIEIVRGYWESAVSLALTALLTWVVGILWAQRNGVEVPWHISVIIFLAFFPFISFRIWLDQKRRGEEKINSIEEAYRQQIKTFEYLLTATKTTVAVPVLEPITTFDIENDAIVLTLPSVPIPESVRLKITSMFYNIYDSPGMLVRGRNIYLKNVDKPENVQFFDVLPYEIARGSVTVEYHPYSAEGKKPPEFNDTLALYFREGQKLLKEYDAPLDVPFVPVKKWVREVSRCLRNNLNDDSYVVQFEKDTEESKHENDIQESLLALRGVSKQNRKVHHYLSARLHQLYEIMKELRD